jgi:uncharacterized protein YpuA (DUF1002 family)
MENNQLEIENAKLKEKIKRLKTKMKINKDINDKQINGLVNLVLKLEKAK